MDITSVSYSRLVSTGDYENEKVGAVANVDDGQDAAVVLSELRAWVNEGLTLDSKRRDTADQLRDTEWRLRNAKNELRNATKRWAMAREFLKLHGLPVPPPATWEDEQDDDDSDIADSDIAF